MTARWQRWWARAMKAKLIWILFGGLIVYQIVALALISSGDSIHALSRRQVLAQTLTSWRVANALLQNGGSAEQASRLLPAMNEKATQYRVDAQSAVGVHSMNKEESSLHADLRRGTGLAPEAVHVSLVIDTSDRTRARLGISLALPDGHWVNTVQEPMMNGPWWRSRKYSSPIMSLVVLAIGILFVQGTMRAIRDLSRNAERASRGEQVQPLPLTGPAEARELTASFNAMRQRMARHVEEQAQMLGFITHDLRTLIASLRLRAELVDDDALRHAMQRTLKDMGQMVEESLRLAGDDARSEPTTDTDLASLLREIAADQAALGREVELQLPDGAQAVPYRCRQLGIRRALINLIDNAVRYGCRARISCEAAGDEGEPSLRIVIDDDGPGIAPAQMENVFKPFFRLGREPGGAGLGLTIARSCIEAHGGRLLLNNRAHQGLRAIAILPV